MTDKIMKKIENIVDDEYGRISTRYGDCLIYEIPADYRDEIGSKEVCEILMSEDPMQSLDECLYDAFSETICCYEMELKDKAVKELRRIEKDGEDYGDWREDEVLDYIRECICFEAPIGHFLRQEFCVDVMMDTGDGNYDYTLNAIYPCYYGRHQDRIEDKASIIWLTKQQGYRKGDLKKVLSGSNEKSESKFLKSVRRELLELPSYMSTVTFLVRMTLEDLITLSSLIQMQDRNGHFWDATKNPYCGYIVLDKNTMTGLYNQWDGGGSLFEIELEKDVKVPIKYIRSALPDGSDGNWSVENVYGMMQKSWKKTVKDIHAPVSQKETI